MTNGLPAALPLYPTQMVGFGKVLTTTQIQDVSTFLAKYSGGYKTCTECAGITPTGFPVVVSLTENPRRLYEKPCRSQGFSFSVPRRFYA